MSIRANATKPQRNVSNIVDLQRRNFRSELTVTIPDNDTLTLPFIDSGDHFYASTSFNALSTCANSELFQHFVNCFDQMKLMDVHYCIDLANSPQYTGGIKQMACQRQAMAYSLDNGVNWAPFNGVTEIPDPNDQAHAIHVITQATMNGINAGFPVNGMYPAEVGDIVTTKTIECPIIVAAATRRAVPRGFFQGDPSVYYNTPSFNELMSYGSAIYQSKMPGSGVHLSLDCLGSSNSERMMTFPTQMINKLVQLQPALQNGRFAPTIMIGVKTDKFNAAQLRNELTGAVSNNFGEVFHQAMAPEFTNAWQGFIVNGERYIGGAYQPIPVMVKVRCNYTFDMVAENGNHTPMTDEQFAARVDFNDPSGENVMLSIQGYHSVRFKQLRTMPSDKAWEFGHLRFRFRKRNGRGATYNTQTLVVTTDLFNDAAGHDNTSAAEVNAPGFFVHYRVKENGEFDLDGFTGTNDDDGVGRVIISLLLMKVDGDRIECSLVSGWKHTYGYDCIYCNTGDQWKTDLGAFINSYDYCAILSFHGQDETPNVQNDFNVNGRIFERTVECKIAVDAAGNPSVYNISDYDPVRSYTINGRNYSVVTTYLYNVQLKEIKPSV